MTTFLQFHLLTAYPPSNLNRDDNGRPKTAEFGGVTRIRISSQSVKRAWRTSPVFREIVGEAHGVRTRRVGEDVFTHLQSRGVEQAEADVIARYIGGVFGKAKVTGRVAEQLAFVGLAELADAKLVADEIAADPSLMPADWRAHLTEKAKEPKTHPLVSRLLRTCGAATDIAMFGRMFASDPSYNWEAAVNVAHPITTHAAVVEDDFLVAVDDLQRAGDEGGVGTGHITVQAFGSGLFYLYLCVDVDLLTRNLGGDTALAERALEALVTTAATVSPTGKQASFASRARASYILAERGPQQPRMLSTAFLRPISADEMGGDVLGASVSRLEETCGNIDASYGACASARARMLATPDAAEGSLAEVITFAKAAVTPSSEAVA
jgi:CRISPR system Cascade subunit CasC